MCEKASTVRRPPNRPSQSASPKPGGQGVQLPAPREGRTSAETTQPANRDYAKGQSRSPSPLPRVQPLRP